MINFVLPLSTRPVDCQISLAPCFALLQVLKLRRSKACWQCHPYRKQGFLSISQVAKELKIGQTTLRRYEGREFPDMKGFSARNLWDMRRFYEAYQDNQTLRQLVAEIPWGHNLVILNSLKDQNQRIWYIQQIIKYGWSRAVLVHQIERELKRSK